MFVNLMWPKELNCVAYVLYNWLVGSKLVAQMYEEEIHFRICNLNGFGTFDPGDFLIQWDQNQ